MLRHIIFLIIVSVAAILWMQELGHIVYYIHYAHTFTANQLAKILAGGHTGQIVRAILALFLVPFVIAIIPAGLYWLIRRKSWRYFPHVLWILWLILLITIALK